jgi:hypothetical protein
MTVCTPLYERAVPVMTVCTPLYSRPQQCDCLLRENGCSNAD